MPASLPLFLMVMLLAPDPGDKTPTGTKEQILKRFVEELVPLKAGKFRMGSEGKAAAEEQPVHEVSITKPFAMARYEVTQELYNAIMGNEPSKWKGPRNSVEMVSWDDAVAFCKKLTAELRERKLLTDADVIRLPTEAEWEYACRAGTTTAYSFGDDAALLKDHAWFTGNAKGEDPPVGKKKPNAWGLYDMHGYIAEWCQDAWHDDYRNAPNDARAWTDPATKDRVVRGGSWGEAADQCRSASRLKVPGTEKNDRIGFRCVKAAQGEVHGR